MLGAPSMLLVLAGTGVLRGLQDTRTTLLVAVAANAVNIALNATFVLGLRLGLAGSAWGTVIAQSGGGAAYLVVVARGARRAGVGKAPLYLRWASKEDLLLAAFGAHTTAITITDSGNLRDDLTEYTCRLIDSKAGPDGWAFLRLHLEATLIPALHARFSSQIANPHVEGARALLDRALERGDLRPGSPTDLMLDSLYGAVLIKIILSLPGEREQLAQNPRSYAGQIVEFVSMGSAGSLGPPLYCRRQSSVIASSCSPAPGRWS